MEQGHVSDAARRYSWIQYVLAGIFNLVKSPVPLNLPRHHQRHPAFTRLTNTHWIYVGVLTKCAPVIAPAGMRRVPYPDFKHQETTMRSVLPREESPYDEVVSGGALRDV